MPGILIVLLLLASPGLAQDASPPSRAVATAGLREAVRRFLCPGGGVPLLEGEAFGTGRCGTSWWGPEAELPGWDAGLPAPSRAQAACPEGTSPVPAEAQPHVQRCLPP